MSPQQSNNRFKSPKFTSGEKCIFIHLVVTFSIIILTSIIYIIHLMVVPHTRNEAMKLSRQGQAEMLSDAKGSYPFIGMIYVDNNTQALICNTLLLHKRWSLAPAQCTAMRTDPNMAEYLSNWKIKYKIDGEYIHSPIKQTLTHSRFNRENYENNIGLFEHTVFIVGQFFVAPNNIHLNDQVFNKYAKLMFFINWAAEFSSEGDMSDAVVNPASPLNMSMCETYAIPIVETLRNYEFCVNFAQRESQLKLGHGAMFVMDSTIIGFFSWGNLNGKGVPFVILNIMHYKQWFENIVL